MTHRLHIWSLDRMLVCVPASVADATVGSLDRLLSSEPSVDGVLGLLTSGGLGAAPPFLCCEIRPDGVRVLIRGDLHAVAHGDGLSVPLSAGRAGTWHDDVVTDITSITVDLGEGDGATLRWIAGRLPAAEPTVESAPPSERTRATPPPRMDDVPAASPVDGPDPVGAVEHQTLHEPDFRDLVAGVDEFDPEATLEPVVDPDDAPAPELEPESDRSRPDTDGGHDAAPDTTAASLDFSDLLENTRAPAIDNGAPATPVPAETPTPEALTAATATPAASTDASEPGDEHAPPQSTAAQSVAPTPGDAPPISYVPDAQPASSTGPATSPTPLAAVAPAAPGLGDHDGHTMTLSDLQRLREHVAASSPDVMALASAETPRVNEVSAVLCPYGHANPTTANACRACGTQITDSTVHVVPRPTLARLVFDSGLVVDVDRPQLIGRKPTAPTDVDEIPNLITLASPDSDISRLHTRVRIEGWDLLVEDVGSTNGTEIKLPNQEPVRIREHDPVLVVPGTEVTLANAVRFRVDPPSP